MRYINATHETYVSNNLKCQITLELTEDQIAANKGSKGVKVVGHFNAFFSNITNYYI